MVSGNTMHDCLIPLIYCHYLYIIVNSQLKYTLFFIDIKECLMEDIQCDSDTFCVNKNENYSYEGKRFCGNI